MLSHSNNTIQHPYFPQPSFFLDIDYRIYIFLDCYYCNGGDSLANFLWLFLFAKSFKAIDLPKKGKPSTFCVPLNYYFHLVIIQWMKHNIYLQNRIVSTGEWQIATGPSACQSVSAIHTKLASECVSWGNVCKSPST